MKIDDHKHKADVAIPFKIKNPLMFQRITNVDGTQTTTRTVLVPRIGKCVEGNGYVPLHSEVSR